MVAHHRRAIALAEAALELGADPELRLLAESIIDARQQQVQEMSDFRAARYGRPASTSEAGAQAPATTSRTTGPET